MSSREDEALAGRNIPNDATVLHGVTEALSWEDSLKDTHITVRVVNSVVTLLGEVASPEQKRLAGERAERVWGVGQVVNQLRVSRKKRSGKAA